MAVMEGDGGLRRLGRKLGRNWLPVLIVSMLAIVAVAELNTPYMPAALWLCAVIAILAAREGRRRLQQKTGARLRRQMSKKCPAKASFPA